MLTVFALLSGMENSSRLIERRTAREWWVRGLLPKPTRRRLGYGWGTETFWADKRVLAQAQAAYDLFHRQRKRVSAHDVVVSLWLLGFPISPDTAKVAFLKRLMKSSNKMMKPNGDLEDGVWTVASRVTREIGGSRQVPSWIRENMTDVLTEIFGLFAGVPGEDTLSDLAPLWEQVGPYLIGGAIDDKTKLEKVQWESFVELIPFFRKNASFPAQIEAMERATKYEVETMHRLLRLATVILKRLNGTSAGEAGMNDEELIFKKMLLYFGPAILPVIVATMQDASVRRSVIHAILYMLRQTRNPAFMEEFKTERMSG